MPLRMAVRRSVVTCPWTCMTRQKRRRLAPYPPPMPWHGRYDRVARWGRPSLTPIAQHLGGERQVAHQECFVALEARALGRLSLDDHLAGDPVAVALGATGPAPALAGAGP